MLNKVSIEDRRRLFSGIKKGENVSGGVFGGTSPKREPSPSLFVSSKGHITSATKKEQRYNHSQVDPIIIRGSQNIDANHLAIRKRDFK